MDDLISRQVFDKFLKDAEEEAVKKRKYVFASALNTIRGNLRDFPSAQPNLDEWCTDCKEYDSEKNCCPRWNRVIRNTLKEQAEWKKGKWLCSDDMYETGVCSACKWDSGEMWVNCKKWFNYCPNCGADMRGEQDEID